MSLDGREKSRVPGIGVIVVLAVLGFAAVGNGVDNQTDLFEAEAPASCSAAPSASMKQAQADFRYGRKMALTSDKDALGQYVLELPKLKTDDDSLGLSVFYTPYPGSGGHQCGFIVVSKDKRGGYSTVNTKSSVISYVTSGGEKTDPMFGTELCVSPKPPIVPRMKATRKKVTAYCDRTVRL